MQGFVFIFRQPRVLNEAERMELATKARAWAQRYNHAGHSLDPRMLGAEKEYHGASGSTVLGINPVTALLFLEAKDLQEAADIAALHPGIEYGATVEVRPWARPAGAGLPAVDGGLASSQ